MHRLKNITGAADESEAVNKAGKVLQRLVTGMTKTVLILFVPFWIESVREVLERII